MMRDMKERWREDDRRMATVIWRGVAVVVSVVVSGFITLVLLALGVPALVGWIVLAIQIVIQLGLLAWVVAAFIEAMRIR